MIIFAKKHFAGKRAKLFSLLINLGIYLRAGLAILNRIIKKISLPFLDAIYICGGLLLFLIIAPFVFVNFKLQLAFMLILIILALTWNIQGGEMGYNTFGNIMFFGVGMYLCASIQIGMYFPLAEWTESGGEKTFVHEPDQYFKGLFAGLAFAAIIPPIIAA